MKRTLFDIGNSEEPLLAKARRRLEKADENKFEAERLFEFQGPEAYPKLVAATVEQRRAEKSLRQIEQRELKRAH